MAVKEEEVKAGKKALAEKEDEMAAAAKALAEKEEEVVALKARNARLTAGMAQADAVADDEGAHRRRLEAVLVNHRIAPWYRRGRGEF